MSDSWWNYNSFGFCSPKIIRLDMKMWKTTNPSLGWLAGMVWFINNICLTVWYAPRARARFTRFWIKIYELKFRFNHLMFCDCRILFVAASDHIRFWLSWHIKCFRLKVDFKQESCIAVFYTFQVHTKSNKIIRYKSW